MELYCSLLGFTSNWAMSCFEVLRRLSRTREVHDWPNRDGNRWSASLRAQASPVLMASLTIAKLIQHRLVESLACHCRNPIHEQTNKSHGRTGWTMYYSSSNTVTSRITQFAGTFKVLSSAQSKIPLLRIFVLYQTRFVEVLFVHRVLISLKKENREGLESG